eukprot:8496820-Alexandrium_andersonii.AAC.1
MAVCNGDGTPQLRPTTRPRWASTRPASTGGSRNQGSSGWRGASLTATSTPSRRGGSPSRRTGRPSRPPRNGRGSR